MPTANPEFQTVKETAESWGVTKRYVNLCIEDGRLPGAVKMGNQWLIPHGTEKPAGVRSARKTPNDAFLGFEYIMEQTIRPAPSSDPDAVLEAIGDHSLRLPMEAELAYLRGDFASVKECYRRAEGEAALRLRAAPVTIAAAISTGDYPLYLEIEAFLKQTICSNADTGISAFAELSLATAHTGAFAPNIAPEWLKNGDFSALHPKARTDAIYKRAKYFQCLGSFEPMLNISLTALSMCDDEHTISFHGIYFRVACAMACVGLGREEDAKRYLASALDIALPHGFIAPFAESAPAFGGLLETLLEREHPECYDAVMDLWAHTYTNWLSFHNRFTKDNITLMLSLREYELAQAVARRVPYAQIANQHRISVSRLKGLMEIVYGKLLISGRNELSKFLL